MGGYSYTRDVYGTSSGWGSDSSSSYSSYSVSAMSASTLDMSMRPLDKILTCKSKHPIIIMLDVTGSNTDFAKIFYDKAPMFYGQIEQKKYFEDFEVSVCAVGDAYSDGCPLQIADFAKGIEIDDWLGKLYLEGRGGSGRCESYELAAYYLLHNFKFDDGVSPMIFFLADEAPYNELSESHINRYVDSKLDIGTVSTKSIFSDLLNKIPNTYVFLNPYCGYTLDTSIRLAWKNLFPSDMKSHVVFMQEDNEKSIVDLILGVIAMVGDKGVSLESYKVDMLDRGQTAERIASVSSTLSNVSNSLSVMNDVTGLVSSDKNSRVRNHGNRRL